MPRVSSATTYSPLKVLFVANGSTTQETYIQNHLTALGATVTKMKDYNVKSTTNFAAYNLVLITEFAPNIPSSALTKLKTAGVPVLIVEYWDFWYSYKLGLTTTDACGYYGSTRIELLDEDTRGAEYVGQTPQVYSTSYTLYGIDEFDLKAGVEPVAWSSESFGELAMIIDPARKIAATGVYDTRKYTTEAWMLFDETISEIAPLGPAWASDDEALQGYIDSGLWSYINNLTGNESAATVRAAVWPKIYAYNLHQVIPTIEYGIQQKLGPSFGLFTIPPMHLQYPHPEYSDDHDDMLWFAGEHCDRSDGYCDSSDDYSVPAYPKIPGVDLGISAKLGSRTYFYMGDTKLDTDGTNTAGTTNCIQNANGAVQCNDSILRLKTWETNPSDGIDAEVISDTFDKTKFLPQTIAGVHRDYSNEVWDVDSDSNWPFSVPVGASVAKPTKTVWLAGTQTPVTLPFSQVRLWYVTQGLRGDDPHDTAAVRLAGKSWVGCSLNGTTFENCYPKHTQGNNGSPVYPYFSKLNFVIVSPVEIGADELAAMGNNAPTHGTDINKGTLLFGVTRPYRCGKMYLAYIDAPNFGRDDSYGRPLGVLYYTGLTGSDMWSTLEAQASPLFSFSCPKNYSDLDDTDGEQGALYESQSLIDATLLEEQLWTWATTGDMPASPPDEDFTGCGYADASQCYSSTCYMKSKVITKDSADDVTCHFCSEDDMTACVSHIMGNPNMFSLMNYPWPATDGFGELSVKLVKDAYTSGLVMLSSHPVADWDEREEIESAIQNGIRVNPFEYAPNGFSRFDYRWNRRDVFFRRASVSSPWSWTDPVDTGAPGYVGGVIDAFTSFTSHQLQGLWIHNLTLWFTTSVWHGALDHTDHYGMPGAYGVYTTSTAQSWSGASWN